jgi:hypothetical protein
MIKINMVELEQIVKDVKKLLENADENQLAFRGSYYAVFSERLHVLERIGAMHPHEAGRLMRLLIAAVDRGARQRNEVMTAEEKRTWRLQNANE